MTKIKHFTDLEAWQIVHGLVLGIYRVIQNFPASEKFGIIDQLRRAASSIAANIAEGWGRYHFADSIRFYYQARGSLSEVQYFLILSKDLGFLKEEDFSRLYEISERSGKLINGLIRSVDRNRRQLVQ